MKVSIIVLNWNGYKDTIECLESLQKVKVSDCELDVIVVDNASTDDSVKQLRKLKNDFQLIESDKNLGFAGGNNLGMKQAIANGAEYIFILNNDTEVHKDIIVELLKVMRSERKIGLATPKIYFAKGYEFHKDRYKKNELGKIIWSAGGDIDWSNVYGVNHGVDYVDNGQFDNVAETDFATGAATMINVAALKSVGSFNEDYFLYLEDLELSERMRRKGWKIMYVPKAVVWHKVSQSSAVGGGLNDYYTTRNRLKFGMKYASFRTKLALFRESLRMLFNGRKWQKVGVMDYYVHNLGKGSWK